MAKQKLATLCYFFVDGRILLLHRTKKKNDIHQDKYIGVGGKLESYESPREGMMREIFEETGVRPLDLTYRALIYFKEDGNLDLNPALNYLVFVYTATGFEGEIVTNSPEGDLLWFTLDEFMQLNLWEGDKIFVPKVVQERSFFEAVFEYTPAEELLRYLITEL